MIVQQLSTHSMDGHQGSRFHQPKSHTLISSVKISLTKITWINKL